jgi:nucleotide-binding universal stress UspA family protein
MIKIANVLVATDFGPASETALAYGRDLARTFGAALHVLHVIENPMLWAGPETASIDFMAVQKDMEAGAQAALGKVVTAEDRTQLKAVTAVRSGPPALEIIGYARDAHADIIIMGTHGRGLMGHLFMGSVAERVVRMAGCPVLTVRHPEHEFLGPDALQTVASTKR